MTAESGQATPDQRQTPRATFSSPQAMGSLTRYLAGTTTATACSNLASQDTNCWFPTTLRPSTSKSWTPKTRILDRVARCYSPISPGRTLISSSSQVKGASFTCSIAIILAATTRAATARLCKLSPEDRMRILAPLRTGTATSTSFSPVKCRKILCLCAADSPPNPREAAGDFSILALLRQCPPTDRKTAL